MALTKGGFMTPNSPGSPDRRIVSGKAVGPDGTGNYGDPVASPGFSGDADSAAAAVYGDPPNATRMNRRAGVAAEALDASPNGIAGCDNETQAFIDGHTSGSFDVTPDGGAAPRIGGSPGFPGEPYSTLESQGGDVAVPSQAAKTVGRGASRAGDAGLNPAVKGSPGFPGLP